MTLQYIKKKISVLFIKATVFSRKSYLRYYFTITQIYLLKIKIKDFERYKNYVYSILISKQNGILILNQKENFCFFKKNNASVMVLSFFSRFFLLLHRMAGCISIYVFSCFVLFFFNKSTSLKLQKMISNFMLSFETF